MLELILLSLGLSCATGVLSLVTSKARAASKTIACVGGMGAAMTAMRRPASGFSKSVKFVKGIGPIQLA